MRSFWSKTIQAPLARDHDSSRRTSSPTKSLRLYRVIKIAFIILVVWSLLAWAAGQWLLAPAELEHADAIVVLSGSTVYRERAERAAQLYAEKRAPLVLLTNDTSQGGWSTKLQRNPQFVERAKEELVRRGVPESSILVVPGPVTSTYDEARAVREFVGGRKMQSLLLVTSAFHSRRTIWTFRKVLADREVRIGLEFSGLPTKTSSFFWWLTPAGWRDVAGEYVKMLYYRLKV